MELYKWKTDGHIYTKRARAHTHNRPSVLKIQVIQFFCHFVFGQIQNGKLYYTKLARFDKNVFEVQLHGFL